MLECQVSIFEIRASDLPPPRHPIMNVTSASLTT
jgi:hypothetical protein